MSSGTLGRERPHAEGVAVGTRATLGISPELPWVKAEKPRLSTVSDWF